MLIDDLTSPLASSSEEAIQYMDSELSRAVPTGWRVRHETSNNLCWSICATEPAGSILESSYGIQVSKGLDLVVFTFGNSDAGPWPRLYHVLQLSLTITGGALRQFGVAACLQYLMQHHQPNTWGYS